MRKTTAPAVALAALALWGVVTATAAVRNDVDRFGARRDGDDSRELRSTLPRNAAGALDVPKLIVEIRAALTRGARDIRFRDTTLTAGEANRLRDLAERFGFEAVRIREDGRHVVRVEFRDVDPNDRERAGPRRDAREDAVTHVELRERAPRPERAEKPEHAEKPERAEKVERAERADRPERGDHSGRH